MKTEEKKNQKDRAGFSGFGCFPQGFQGISEMMRNCCAGHGETSDSATMMNAMMEMCCGSKTESAKTDAESQKEPDSETKTSQAPKTGDCSS